MVGDLCDARARGQKSGVEIRRRAGAVRKPCIARLRGGVVVDVRIVHRMKRAGMIRCMVIGVACGDTTCAASCRVFVFLR